jgi:glycerophosphoryl diester phosphodiesterase
MNSTGRPIRIAHAYGNNRGSLARALSAEIDMIEVDLCYRGGELFIRHERRLGPFPVLADKRMAGHKPGFLAIPLWKGYYVRPDVRRFRLRDLLKTVAGKRRLLLDTKGTYHPQEVDAFILALSEQVAEHNAQDWVAVCGQNFAIIDRLRETAPSLELRYSIEAPFQWDEFLRLATRDESVRRICIQHRFLDEEKLRFAEENGIDVYCWTVDDLAEASRLVALGADGIISNDLSLLAGLQTGASAAG